MRLHIFRGHKSSLWKQLISSAVAIILPYVIYLVIFLQDGGVYALNITFIVSAIAAFISTLFIIGLGRYPGVEQVSSVLSSVLLAYAMLMAILLIGRLDYARGLLFGSYVLTSLFLLAQPLIWPSQQRLRIAVVYSERVQPLPKGNIDWIYARDPDAPFSKIDAVAVDLHEDLSEDWKRRLVDLALNDVPVYHIKHLRESITGQVEIEHLSETSYGMLSRPLAYVAIKRAMDFSIAFAALIILVPVFAAIVILVRIDSPGPALFKQRRIGFRGRPFIAWKFRTMIASDPQQNSRDAAMTQKEDVRITRIGRFLRKSRLDELPQLINILRGEMSLIGPRPEAEILSEWYEQEIPFYRYRHIVKPGLTGWAQINQGHVTDVKDVTYKLHYDFYYIKNLSPWIDAVIIIRTLMIMISGFGAK